MNKLFLSFVLLILLTQSQMQSQSLIFPIYTRQPEPAIYNRNKLTSLPYFNPNNTSQFQLDIKSSDLSNLDLRDREQDLLNADFDNNTRWPILLPKSFNPFQIMELGRNPGLCIRTLHQKGITGKGVSLAIIDMPLLINHDEYCNRLHNYEEIPPSKDHANMHGSGVASIAVGKTVGVAPEADLYYIATKFNGRNYIIDKDFEGRDFTWLAKAIDRVLEINNSLPSNKKIRAISISIGWSSLEDGYKEVCEAVERAKHAKVFIVSCSIRKTYSHKKFAFHGMGRNPVYDPDCIASYGPGHWWKQSFATEGIRQFFPNGQTLLVPMDSRCVAAPTGPHNYIFCRHNGWSWCMPYITGLYALACQVKPDITPEQFWQTALDTGDHTVIEINGVLRPFEVIVNPARLLMRLKNED